MVIFALITKKKNQYVHTESALKIIPKTAINKFNIETKITEFVERYTLTNLLYKIFKHIFI